MAETYQVRIEKLVYGGDGLGRLPDGRAVFVPFVLPDELVMIELVEEKARFARGSLVKIIETLTGPDRTPLRTLYRVRRLPVPAPRLCETAIRQGIHPARPVHPDRQGREPTPETDRPLT